MTRAAEQTRAGAIALPWLVPLSCALVIAVSSRLRYPPPDLALASPAPWPGWAWSLAIAGLIAGLILVAAVARARLADPAVRRVLGELAAYPLVLAVVWAVLPPYTQQYRPWHYLAVAAMAGVFGYLLWRDRVRRTPLGLGRAGFGAALRDLVWPTLALLAAGLALAALTVGFAPRWQRMSVNVFTYPVSAIVQLLLLQVLLLRRLERISNARGATVLAAASVFGLAHWPNPILAPACFLGALLWCRVYLARGNLPAIALSMGLLAAILGNAVPREAIDNARTGPIYIQRKVDAASRLAAPAATAPDPAAPAKQGSG